MLSIRLQTIANLIQDCDILLDVGSDHGLLPYELLRSGRIKRALITDINELPLARAQVFFNQTDYKERVECILSDGLNEVQSDFDAVVIAGMGHHTILNIVRNGIDKLRHPHRQLLIQSNTNVPALRESMHQLGFTLINEALLNDRNHYYVVLKYAYNQHHVDFDACDVLIGPILRYCTTTLMMNYLEHLIKKEKNKMRGQNLTSTTNYEILMTHLREIQTACHK